MSNENFDSDTRQILDFLLGEAQLLNESINKFPRESENQTAYYAYLKDFVVNSGVLCDDIFNAIGTNGVLLAMIGTRTLLEDTINVHYLASKKSELARIKTANNWFKISNSPKLHKNILDGKSVKNRAMEAGDSALKLYSGEYADFCNYSHATAHRAVLNSQPHWNLLANKTLICTVKAYANIITCVCSLIEHKLAEEFNYQVNTYLSSYRKSISQAALPKII